ncbi:uncharacterized protein METZ01_LOCUS452065, partial [marine metagenome]
MSFGFVINSSKEICFSVLSTIFLNTTHFSANSLGAKIIENFE